MVGLTTYTEFKPGDDCYIVVFTPISRDQKVIEFLEGKVKEFASAGAVLPYDHPLLRYLNISQKMIRAIHAEVTDPKVANRSPIDPIHIHQEPQRNYLVVPPQECVRYLKQAITQTQNSLERTQKMNFVQQQRIGQLETTLSHYQRRR